MMSGCGFHAPRVLDGRLRCDWRARYRIAARLVRKPWLESPRWRVRAIWGISAVQALAVMQRDR